MMDVDWIQIKEVLGHLLEHYLLRICLYAALFVGLAFIISVLLTRFIHKRKLLQRQPKLYHYGIKLIYPYIFLISIYFFALTGLGFGFKSALKLDSNNLGELVYDNSMALSFENDSSKKATLNHLAEMVKTLQQTQSDTKVKLKEVAQLVEFKSKLLEKTKDATVSFLVSQYGDEIFTRMLYATLLLAPNNDFVELEMSYKDFNKAISNLLLLDADDIEQSIKESIGVAIFKVLRPQFNAFILSQLFVWLLLMSLPFVEILIYRKYRRKKAANPL